MFRRPRLWLAPTATSLKRETAGIFSLIADGRDSTVFLPLCQWAMCRNAGTNKLKIVFLMFRKAVLKRCDRFVHMRHLRSEVACLQEDFYII